MFPSADARRDLQCLRLGEAAFEPEGEAGLFPEQRVPREAGLAPELEHHVSLGHPEAGSAVDADGFDVAADLRQLRDDRAARVELAHPDPPAVEENQLAGGGVDADVVRTAEPRQERLEAEVALRTREGGLLPEDEWPPAYGRHLVDLDHGPALQA